MHKLTLSDEDYERIYASIPVSTRTEFDEAYQDWLESNDMNSEYEWTVSWGTEHKLTLDQCDALYWCNA